MDDSQGNWWHASTMRISRNHDFERRIGIWPAGFDADGELFCNQRYGDWPQSVTGEKKDPWAAPGPPVSSAPWGSSVTVSTSSAKLICTACTLQQRPRSTRRRNTDTDLPHNLVVWEDGLPATYIRLTVIDTPYHRPACISGLRVFGRGCGSNTAPHSP